MAGEKEKTIPNYVKFALGGLAGMSATCFVQPLDLVKNRMQLSAGLERVTSAQIIKGILKNEGFFAFYNGLSAGLLRQATYTTTRLGSFQFFMDYLNRRGQAPNFAERTAAGMLAGVCGAFVGTPAEVALIRMTGDGKLPVAERRNYKNVFDALFRIAKDEGVSKMWRGAIPTMNRAIVVNAAQLATYSQSKMFLLQNGYLDENIGLHFAASMISGLVTTIASMPVDIIKTRIQSMKVVEGKPEYSGGLDVFKKVIKNEGVFALWKGFMPYYVRIAPHTVLTFIFLEQFTKLYYVHVMGIMDSKGSGL